MAAAWHYLALFTALIAGSEPRQSPVVTLGGNAKLRGKVRYLPDSTKPVFTFLGVPFSEKPVRFLPAETLKLWNGTKDATRPGFACYQNDNTQALKRVMSEDCLFLNVYTPTLDPYAGKAVMVYIHGGGFIAGTGTTYHGTNLASMHDVVVVNFNYRLAGLGFLTTGDSNAPGNIVFHDQLEALRWVQKYIHLFGGDPKKVTLFGVSAGSISVSFHMVSPLSKDLFKRGISQSGTSPLATTTTENPVTGYPGLTLTKSIAKSQGCPTSDTKSMVDCLRTKPAEAFIRPTTRFTPVVDGTFLPDYPYNIYSLGKFSPKDYLSGFSTNEGFMFMRTLNSIMRVNTHTITVASAQRAIRSMLTLQGMTDRGVTNKIIKEYLSDTKDSEKLFKALVDFLGDYIITGKHLDTVMKHAAKAKTYLYQYNYTIGTKQHEKNRPTWLIADHAEEPPLVFGFPFSRINEFNDTIIRRQSYSDQDKTMSRMIMSYFVNFAKTGDPNGPGLPKWPRYTCFEHKRLILQERPTVAQKYFPERLRIWKEDYPKAYRVGTYKITPFKCSGPVIEIGYGATLRGSVSHLNRKPVFVFGGIPYAEPPVRFLPAKPFKLWSGEKDATKFGPACMQKIENTHYMLPPSVDKSTFKLPMSEDCLLLNIWTPTTDIYAGLDVMVWIHGGGFVAGAGDQYPGHGLAAMHDVVVVSINYRLDRLALLTTGDKSAPGNLHLRDQQEALRWVQKYIKYFGGDPKKVTIFGESAGSWSVSYHMLSPQSQPLFRRGISESGSITSKLLFLQIYDMKTAVTNAKTLATSMGCPNNTNSVMVACLRKKPASSLYGTDFGVVIDGNIVPAHPYDLYTEGQVKGKDYLVGFNSHEGYMFIDSLVPMARSLGVNLYSMSHEDARKIVTAMMGPNAGVGQSVAKSAMKNYFDGKVSPGDLFKTMVEFLGDMTMAGATVDVARKHSELAPTYLYFFNHRPGLQDNILPSWVKADHTAEIDFVFGWPLYVHQKTAGSITFNVTYSEEDKVVSRKMMAYWTNFAKTGNPNGQGLPNWPKYKCQDKRYMVLNSNPTVAANFKPAHMALWTETLPAMDKSQTYKGHPWTCPKPSATSKPPIGGASYIHPNFIIVLLALLIAKVNL